MNAGPFSSSGKCRNTAGDLQESTRWSSGGNRVLLKALHVDMATYSLHTCTCPPFVHCTVCPVEGNKLEYFKESP